MGSNFNDIIDVILTFNKNEELSKNIAVSGSIVPYIVTNKESLECHTDFYFLVKHKKINDVRDIIKKLSKEYTFDIVSDSKKYSAIDYGFKIKYENTVVGFFPYSIVDNNFTIRTFSITKGKKEAGLKTKAIPNITKSSVIRYVNFNGDDKIRIVSPEFILASKEMSERKPGNPTPETIKLLREICDESVLQALRENISKAKVNVEYRKSKKFDYKFMLIVIFLVAILIFLAYKCFKK